MRPEIAFVVAMDRVGFSLLPIERKAELSAELLDAIHRSSAFRLAAVAGDVIALDSGDGAALVFFGDPIAAIQAALDVHAAVNRPGVGARLRIGVHAGPVVRRLDVAGKPNVDGHGIELAVRAMSVADGSAVLVSQAYADMLRAFDEWGVRLGDGAEHEVKHGVRILVHPVLDASAQPSPEPLEGSGGSGLRVAVAYKRHAEPDGSLLAKLETRIREAGMQVFVDRHMSIGVEWAQEIERKLRSSDAVIVLLSDRATESEMMLYELQVASDERDQRGKPAILPVRVGSDTPVGGDIGQLVSRFQYFHWSGAADDERLWAELESALLRPEPTRPEAVAPIEQAGGAVPLGSPYYIERDTDTAFLDAIARQDSIVLVKGARQMGKTSILARGVQFARDREWRVVLTDFQTLSSSQLESDERLYKSLMHAFKTQLGLDVDLAGCWNDWLGANTNLEQFLENDVLPRTDGRLVWALDEVDRLFNRCYASDFFGMIRSWHNRRALEPHGVWQRFTVALAYATEAHLFISDLNQSPFNVGTRLALSDFDLSQVRTLNVRYGGPLRDEAELKQFYELLHGQPYLTRRALDELARGMSLGDMMRLADHDEGIFGDHLRRLMVAIAGDATLAQSVRAFLAGQTIAADTFYRLRAGGLLKGDSPANAAFRCRIYETYLRPHLV